MSVQLTPAAINILEQLDAVRPGQTPPSVNWTEADELTRHGYATPTGLAD
ncbi:hypothetical protein [Ralstonia pickettii]|nr:hypothetical protein [Ralstonia pickettii]